MGRKKLQPLLTAQAPDNRPFPLTLTEALTIDVYPRSVTRVGDDYLFLGREATNKSLFVAAFSESEALLADFSGDLLRGEMFEDVRAIKRCALCHENADAVRARLHYARPRCIGVHNSFGLGDRLGLANPAHLQAIAETDFKAVLAQQSIRELQRTQRKPEDVLDAATWAVLQEGYKTGFGADADHLKTTDDIDLMVRAGFTMFTFDPGEHVVNDADSLPLSEVQRRIASLPWQMLQEDPQAFVARYENRTFRLSARLTLRPGREQVLRGLLKYGGVIAHAVRLYRYFKETYPSHAAEFELSVDETESVTTPFEHFLVANELKRRGVELVSLAPRFVGDFEKGIDYKGDLDAFRREYIKHLEIAEALGPYKLSIHSGSDKFRVYRVIGSIQAGHVHVKTAGTSYLEALRTVAATRPALFREILDFARERYDEEKRSYHVSAELERVPASRECSDARLLELFEENDARQVLHVTYGRVLTEREAHGRFLFRERLLSCLREHEEAHYTFLYKHFRKHLEPFLRTKG